MMTKVRAILTAALLSLTVAVGAARADTGDPQLKTDHPWYPGELSCSTFDRLFKTQAELYTRVTGRDTGSDEDKALASWYWRNLTYAHAIEGTCNYSGKGFLQSDFNREYWRGLFGSGFGVCYTTHSQWAGELEKLLGHCRSRQALVPGHTSHEVFLTGGPYGDGKWVLLDHDISTVIFSEDGSRLLSVREIKENFAKFSDPAFRPERQRGWRVGGLHDGDPKAYSEFKGVGYEAGYAGPPPIVHLRSGEVLRKYLQPGLEDGKTFVYWGMNYSAEGIQGPQRDRTWVNQPENMYKSARGTGSSRGSRYGNAVYTYVPDFKSGRYKEGVIDEDDRHVTFEFYTPFAIAGTPVRGKEGEGNLNVYKDGAKNGLLLLGKATCPVKVSVDQGRSWKETGAFSEGLDLTDLVKGGTQYWIRFEASAKELADSGLTMKTVCQTNQALIPHLHDGKNRITFLSGGRGFISAGPNVPQAEAHVVDGKFGSPSVTMELATPRREKAVHVYAMAHVTSGSPPSDAVYQIDWSTDGGKSWMPVVKDWKILRRGDEPDDFWSQSMCYGDAALDGATGPVRVRFSNNSKRTILRAEVHLEYDVPSSGPVEVTFAWKENGGALKKETHTYPGTPGKEDSSWELSAGEKVETIWVEYRAK
jgi:hypothetical protein